MISPLDLAVITRKQENVVNASESYWDKIEPQLEKAFVDAAKIGRHEIFFEVQKEFKVHVASRLMNMGYRLDYDPLNKNSHILKISWGNKLMEASRKIYMEEHVCECTHCKRTMK